MAASHYKRVEGTVTLLASHSFACANRMGLTSLKEVFFIGDSSRTTGKPGFGGRALPALAF